MRAGAASDSFPVLSDLTLHTSSTCLPLIHEEVLTLTTSETEEEWIVGLEQRGLGGGTRRRGRRGNCAQDIK